MPLRLRVRYRHWLPRTLGVGAIVLYPFVLFSGARERVSERLIRHEMIHVRQVRRLGIPRFYARYVGEWLLQLWRRRGDGDAAYRAISFEREAYAGEERVALSERERQEFETV